MEVIGTKRTEYAYSLYIFDEAVGAIVSTLERLEMMDNTYLIFASDNGGKDKLSQPPITHHRFFSCLSPLSIIPSYVAQSSVDMPYLSIHLSSSRSQSFISTNHINIVYLPNNLPSNTHSLSNIFYQPII